MNSKITFVELVNQMAEATSTNKRVCELFLKDLFATVSQALIDGDNVKIKGVGTFKITRAKSRKSVNVRTGEDNQIAEHNKLTFTPDKSLADAVNQPFAQFETVFLDDAVTDQKLAEIDEQMKQAVAAPVVDAGQKNPTLNEVEQTVEDEKIDHDITAVQDAGQQEADMPLAPLPFDLPEMSEAAPAPSLDDLLDSVPAEVGSPDRQAPAPVKKKAPASVVEPAVQAPVQPMPVDKKKPEPERKPMLVGIPIDGPSQPVPEPEKEEEPNTGGHFYRPEPRNVYTPTPEQIEDATRKPDRRWLWLALSALAIALMFWLMVRGTGDSSAEQQEQEVVAADTLIEVGDSLVAVKAEPKPEKKSKPETQAKPEPKPEPKAEVKAELKPEAKAESKPKQSSNSGTVTDVVTSQIVLTTLSEKHYGSPWFWVYIYEENRDRGIISDPNNIRPGTRVIIPPADKYGINPHDKASLKKAQLKSWQYLKGK